MRTILANLLQEISPLEEAEAKVDICITTCTAGVPPTSPRRRPRRRPRLHLAPFRPQFRRQAPRHNLRLTVEAVELRAGVKSTGRRFVTLITATLGHANHARSMAKQATATRMACRTQALQTALCAASPVEALSQLCHRSLRQVHRTLRLTAEAVDICIITIITSLMMDLWIASGLAVVAKIIPAAWARAATKLFVKNLHYTTAKVVTFSMLYALVGALSQLLHLSLRQSHRTLRLSAPTM